MKKTKFTETQIESFINTKKQLADPFLSHPIPTTANRQTVAPIPQ